MNALASIATVTPIVRLSEVIDLESFADLLSDSIIMEKTDIGSALVYKVRHPISGSMVMINTTGDKNLVMYV